MSMEVLNRITPHFNQYFGVIDLIILLNFFQTHRCMLMPDFFFLQIEQKDIAVNCQLRMLSAPCLVRIPYICMYVSSKPSQKVCKHLQRIFDNQESCVLPKSRYEHIPIFIMNETDMAFVKWSHVFLLK
jgi:hypothetical protein